VLGLVDILNRRPGQLSGGQQQRVALGRAVVRRPGVFLLDEPLSHLDGRLRGELRHELHLLQRQLRATMIYVTHDQAEAMTLADRVAVMDRGVIQQVDRPLVVYEQPANRFVAGFIGWPPMNLVDGWLQPRDGQLCFACDGWCWELPAALYRRLRLGGGEGPMGRAVTLGFRPEDIHPALPGQTGATLRMEVALVESLGHSRLMTLRFGGWQCVAISPGSTAHGLPDRNLAVKEGWTEWERSECKAVRQAAVSVSFDLDRAHWFDRSTGLALRGGTFQTCPTNSRPAG
jgi:multiple sugar transport system ATP-binding protein